MSPIFSTKVDVVVLTSETLPNFRDTKSVSDLTPDTVAYAVFVRIVAVTSPAVTEYDAVHITDSPGSRLLSRSPIPDNAGHDTLIALSSLTVTGPANDTAPTLLTR